MKRAKTFLLGFLITGLALQTIAQEDVKKLRNEIKSDYGVEKLLKLNKLTAIYLKNDVKKAIKNGRQAVDLAENIFSSSNVLQNDEQRFLKVEAYNLLGKAYFFQESYSNALSNFTAAKKEANLLDLQDEEEEAAIFLFKLDSLERAGVDIKDGFLKKLGKKINIGETISNTSSDLNINTILKIAATYEKKQNYARAIENYKKAINLLSNRGEARRIANLHVKVADLYKKSGNFKESLAYYQLSIEENEKIGDSAQVKASENELAGLFENLQSLQPKTEPIVIEFDSAETKQLDDFKLQAENFVQSKDYGKAIEYYRLYSDLKAELVEEKRRKEIDSLDLQNQAQEIRLLLQQSELNELALVQKENELEKQARFRNSLIIGALLLFTLLVSLYFLYKNRVTSHKILQGAYTDLENTQGKLIDAEQKIKRLLGQQVSGEIAETLIAGNQEKVAVERKFVCIMFLDIRGFTPFAETKEPEEIIQYQNQVFGFMIDVINKYHGNINQFLGDGFMATFGAPKSHGNDCENAFNAAKEIVKMVNEKSANGSIPTTRIGIGLHAGHVVAGNVGTDLRKQYSITGNTVITAARIEQLNKEFQSQLLISETVHQALNQKNGQRDEMMEVNIKGRQSPIKILKVA